MLLGDEEEETDLKVLGVIRFAVSGFECLRRFYGFAVSGFEWLRRFYGFAVSNFLYVSRLNG